MVIADLETTYDKKDSPNQMEDENNNLLEGATMHIVSETSAEGWRLPTELERFKLFSQKVASCTAKSFRETYVHPLIIHSPSSTPCTSATPIPINQNQEGEISIPIYPVSENEDQVKTVQNPKLEKEENQTEPRLITKDDLKKELNPVITRDDNIKELNPKIIRDENKKESHEVGITLDSKEDTKKTAKTISSDIDKQTTAQVQEQKMETKQKLFGLFDVGGILSSYFPHGDLATSDVEEDTSEQRSDLFWIIN